MSRRNVVLLLLAAVGLTAFSVALSRRDSRDWRATRSNRVLPFPWQDVVAVDIRRGGGETLAIRKTESGEWRVEFGDGDIDSLSPRVAESLAAFATLAWKIPADGGVGPDPDAGATLAFTSSSGQGVSVVLGKADGAVRLAETVGEPGNVYGIGADLADFSDLPIERFRSLYLANSGGRKPERIVFSPPEREGVPVPRVTLQRAENGWEMLEPVPWPADVEKVETLLQWLDRLRADTVETQADGQAPDANGFDPESPFIETQFADPAWNRRISFGDVSPSGQVFVRVLGRTPTFTVPRAALAEISFVAGGKRPEFWAHHYRSRNLDMTPDREPAEVVVEQLVPQRAKLVLTAPADGRGGNWRGRLERDGEVREFPVDPPLPDGETPLGELLRGLSSFQIRSFLADSAPGAETLKWTAYPAWRFACKDRDGNDGPILTLYADDAGGALPTGTPYERGHLRANSPREGRGLVCAVSGRDAIMEAFGYFAGMLCLPPYRYRSSKIIDDDASRWEKVVIDAGGGKKGYFRRPDDVNEQWWLDGASPRPLLDDNNRFVALLGELARLRAEGFVEDAGGDVADFGLDRPALNAIVYVSPGRGGTSDGPAFTLSVGSADASGGRYARLNSGGPVFVVSAGLVEALEKEYR